MAELSSTEEQISNNLIDRRGQFRQIERVIHEFLGKTLEHTVVAMAIPMIYAHWEGYVKEICQLYLEYIEDSVENGRSLSPMLLGYLWSPALQPLTGGINAKRRANVAIAAVRSLSSPVEFSDADRSVNTGSNLNFEQLEKIGEQLCIDITSLSDHRHSLNSLVHSRNNIAHGSIPSQLRFADLQSRISDTEELMKDFELQTLDALRRRTFELREEMTVGELSRRP